MDTELTVAIAQILTGAATLVVAVAQIATVLATFVVALFLDGFPI